MSDFEQVLASGESETVEFVLSADGDKFVKSICAFANTQGGVIYVGIDESSKSSDGTPRVIGTDQGEVQKIIRSLDRYFDDPLPNVQEEIVFQRGPKGPVIAVHVDRRTGSQDVALSDLTIWRRNREKNESVTARTRPIRPKSENLTDKLDLSQKVDVEVVRGGAQIGGNAKLSAEGQVTSGDDSTPSAATPSHPRLGNHSIFRREATSTEAALNVDGYAEVIANLLANTDASERMSMAIFGHWGRGKTFLAKRIAESLDANSTSDRPRYKTVMFSAWKYRTTPEVWAYLFERFLQEGKKQNWTLPVRAALVRHGPWPLIIAMFGLFFSLLTMTEKTQALSAIVQAVGVGTVIYAGFLFVRFRSVAVRLKSLYTFASHADKLGLQAAIGDDLRALLKGWCQTKVKETLKKSWLSVFWASLCYAVAAGLITWKLFPVQTKSDPVIPLIGALSLGVNPYVALAFYAVWTVAWVIMPFVLFFWPWQMADRVLLVVDDLDRCEPKQMLEIIESTMLILDDKEVHERLQVCMLIDEAAFVNALMQKYGGLTEDHQAGEGLTYTPSRIVRENIEKFFLLHVRLPPLSDGEIADVAEQYVRQLRSYSDAAQPDPARPHPGTVETPVVSQPNGAAPVNAVPSRQIAVQRSVVEQEEAEAITECIGRELQGSNREVIGPRALRCMLFRYQLARDILFRLGERPTPDELANAVVARYTRTPMDQDNLSKVQGVVNQLS